MRMRVARVGIAFALAALAVSAGMAVPHWGPRAVLTDLARGAAVPVHTAGTTGAAITGLAGARATGFAHPAAAGTDVALAPAVLAALVLLAWLPAARSVRRVARVAPAGAGPRAPPRRRL